MKINQNSEKLRKLPFSCVLSCPLFNHFVKQHISLFFSLSLVSLRIYLVVRSKINQLKSSLVYKRYVMRILQSVISLRTRTILISMSMSSLLSTVLGALWMFATWVSLFSKNNISCASAHNFSSYEKFLKCFWNLFLDLETLSLFIYLKTNEKHWKVNISQE